MNRQPGRVKPALMALLLGTAGLTAVAQEVSEPIPVERDVAPTAESRKPGPVMLVEPDDPQDSALANSPAEAEQLQFNFRGVPLDTVLDYKIGRAHV